MDPDVSAYINGGTINAPGHPVSVSAKFDGTSDPEATAGSGSLTGGAFAGVLAESKIQGTTSAYAGGNTTINAAGLEISADDHSTTTPKSFTLGIALVGLAVDVVSVLGTVSRTTQAYLGAGSVQSGGSPITVHATSHATSTLDSTSIAVTLVGISFSKVTMKSKVDGATKAFVDDGALV